MCPCVVVANFLIMSVLFVISQDHDLRYELQVLSDRHIVSFFFYSYLTRDEL